MASPKSLTSPIDVDQESVTNVIDDDQESVASAIDVDQEPVPGPTDVEAHATIKRLEAQLAAAKTELAASNTELEKASLTVANFQMKMWQTSTEVRDCRRWLATSNKDLTATTATLAQTKKDLGQTKRELLSAQSSLLVCKCTMAEKKAEVEKSELDKESLTQQLKETSGSPGSETAVQHNKDLEEFRSGWIRLQEKDDEFWQKIMEEYEKKLSLIEKRTKRDKENDNALKGIEEMVSEEHVQMHGKREAAYLIPNDYDISRIVTLLTTDISTNTIMSSTTPQATKVNITGSTAAEAEPTIDDLEARLAALESALASCQDELAKLRQELKQRQVEPEVSAKSVADKTVPRSITLRQWDLLWSEKQWEALGKRHVEDEGGK
ncbi:hypothetical protein MMC13_006963 [Lambiella insularis]|nr:hypothetical protein [Lambiella insularis]